MAGFRALFVCLVLANPSFAAFPKIIKDLCSKHLKSAFEPKLGWSLEKRDQLAAYNGAYGFPEFFKNQILKIAGPHNIEPEIITSVVNFSRKGYYRNTPHLKLWVNTPDLGYAYINLHSSGYVSVSLNSVHNKVRTQRSNAVRLSPPTFK